MYDIIIPMFYRTFGVINVITALQ